MARKTPEQIAEKYQRGVAGAGQDYAAGVQSPSRSWAASTAQGANRWRAGLQKAFQENSFQRGVQRAGDSKWQEAAAGKGAQRYQESAPLAAANYQAVAGQIMGAASAAQSAVGNMPNETLEQRIQRSAAAQRATSQYWANRKRAG